MGVRGRSRVGAAVALALTLVVGPLAIRATAGTWVVVSSPNPGAGNNALTGVSCTSATFCMATGVNNGTTSTLIEQWNGSAWSIVASPSGDTLNNPAFNRLNAVSCVNSSFCFAVGYDGNATGQALIEQWNGTAWTIVPSNAPEAFDQLWGVSCVSTNFCIAVGDGGAGGDLILQWNGTAWSQVAAPAPPTGTTAFLQGNVSCFSATSCMAVGFTLDNTTRVENAFSAAWNGTSWTAVPVASLTGFAASQLNGVSCAAANACTGVGFWQNASGTDLGLIEQWNGSTWSIPSYPMPTGAQRSAFAGASCASPTSCIAAGDFNNANGDDDTLIESWDGTTWSVIPTPNPGSDQSFAGVSCAGSTCAAAGSFTPSPHFQTLIEMTIGGPGGIQPPPNCASGSQAGSVQLSGNNRCLNNAHVNGNVTIAPGTNAVILNSTISGSLVGSNAASVTVCNSSTGGSVSLSGSTGFVLVGDPADDGCGGNTINGALSLSSNHAGFETSHNTVAGNLSLSGDAGGGPFPDDSHPEVEVNHVGGSLSCNGDSPAAVDDGQANVVTGARSGECGAPGF